MAEHTVIFYFSFLAVYFKGQTSVIKTQQTVLVEVRGNALLNCQFMQFKDVLQVTWQKILAEGKWNLASYHKTFGKKVNPDFLHKMEFKYAGLQNSSLVIKNVTEQDEGCYGCLFDIQHESPLRGRTCIQVYELHEPVVDVRESNSTADWVVSCSATGRPAPTVTLSVSQQDLNFTQCNTVSVSNSNATFTVTTTAVLSGSRKHSTQVGCAARVLSASHRELMVTIPEVQQTSVNVVIIIVIIASVLVACGCGAVITLLLRKKTQSRVAQMDLEMSETPKTTSRDAHKGRGHLLNSEFRQRTPLQKKNVDQC